MWKFLRAHLSSSLLTIKIRGYAYSAGSRKKASISNAMLKEMSTRCPNLRLLHLFTCNTDNLSFESLRQSITSLSIIKSTLQPRWMKDRQQHLQKLENLNLSKSKIFLNFDLEDIAHWTNLKTLSLSSCYRISLVSGAGLEVIAKNLLESLDISSTGVGDLDVHHIAHHLKDLKEFILACNPDITDLSLGSIASGLPKLNALDISYCSSLTMKGLSLLTTSKLTFLNVVGVRIGSLTEEEVSTLKSSCSHSIHVVA